MDNLTFLICAFSILLLLITVCVTVLYITFEQLITRMRTIIAWKKWEKSHREFKKSIFNFEMERLRLNPDLKDNSMAKKLKGYKEINNENRR